MELNAQISRETKAMPVTALAYLKIRVIEASLPLP